MLVSYLVTGSGNLISQLNYQEIDMGIQTMPHIEKAGEKGKTEKLTKLGEVKTGEVFRFQGTTYEEAIAGENGALFYMVINTQPKKTDRVTIVSMDGQSVQEKDSDHLVIVHPSKLHVGQAPLIDGKE